MITGLRVRINIQRNDTVVDSIGNHMSVWTDCFSCWATASLNGRRVEETEKAGSTQEADRLDFTVRWSSETAAVNSKQYRIILGGHIYNIIGIDEMGFQRKSRKLLCQLVAR